MFLHPLDWSLRSVAMKFGLIGTVSMDLREIEGYKMLPVKDKVVLDIGAYYGDSAKFFLDRGASKVICVELVKKWADQIKLPNTVVFNEPFDLKYLSLKYDVMKMDIEGSEGLLFDYKGVLKPSVIEVHTQYLIDRFEKELGFRRLTEPVGSFAGVRYCQMVNF